MLDIKDENVNILNKSPIVASLAPMAGYTDSVFRKLCGSYGAAYVVSEMISSVALTMNDRKTADLARIADGEPPVYLQIFGHDPKIMGKAAEILLSGAYDGCDYATPPAGIEINMGCPVKKIVSSGDGSALMKDIETASRICSSVKNVCVKFNLPLSVKFRLGYDKNSINLAEFALAMVRSGADKITIHCRTREQMYAPTADPSYITSVNEMIGQSSLDRSKITIVGNGDVDSYESARRYIDLGCDEVAVGRAALGDPWIFAELSSPGNFAPPTLVDRIAVVRKFVAQVVELKGEERGILESRSRAAYFIRGMRGSAKIRDELNHATTLLEFDKILSSIETSPEMNTST